MPKLYLKLEFDTEDQVLLCIFLLKYTQQSSSQSSVHILQAAMFETQKKKKIKESTDKHTTYHDYVLTHYGSFTP